MKRILLLCVVCLGPLRLWADAHGPAFGYATTTLGAGNSSIETVAMYRSGTTMLGPRFSYGVLPDSGSTGIFSGPSFLYTYRDVAFQTGVMFRAWGQVNGNQPAQGIQAVIGVSYFFLNRRK